ncbi:MAG: hydrogenase small subunit [Thiohalomonadaceae bacterium]
MLEKITRREALKRIYGAIVATGAASFLSFEDLLAADATTDKRLNLIWLHGSSCSGCSCSFLDIEYVPVLDILSKFTNVIFHPDLSLATGDQVTGMLEHVMGSNLDFLLVVEGSIPVGMPHACLMGHKPFVEWAVPMAKRATACVAAGTCATFGGVTRMNGMQTGIQTLPELLVAQEIDKPLVCLPGCPMKPEHIVYTLLHYAMKGTLPPLDSQQRPLRFFGNTIHERCIYYADFQEKHYARHIGDSGCLINLGCQGVVTHNDCLINGHNNNTSSCIRAGHPCVGCASEHFPRQIMLHSHDDPRVNKRKF